jgi:AGCS family alanine or glycine:cation symporter
VQANVQANSVASVIESSFGVPPLATGIALFVLTGAVILGGIQRIGAVAGKLVPFMAITYILCGLIVLAVNAGAIPAAIGLVFTHAFTPAAQAGGFAGAAVWAAIRFGVARGMLGTFIDTLIVCSITGLAIIASGAWMSGETGAALTSAAFESSLPGVGGYMVAVVLAIFAFTTILGWSFYSEKCVEFLFGVKSIMPFRILWCVAVPLGAVAELGFVWLLADTLNALMAIPNLIALLLLSPLVFKLTKDFFANGMVETPFEPVARD